MKQLSKEIARQLGLQLFGILSTITIPSALYRVAKVMHPKTSGISEREFFAFGWVDASFRAWYNKLANDFTHYGRFGYAWDDGLGLALGPRIYNNWATYWLLGRLGARPMAGLGYFIASASLALICGHAFGFWVGILAGLLSAGSPLFITNYTHLGKPEMFWWGLAGVSLYLGFSGHMLAAGLVWTFIAFVSLPVSVMLLFMAGPAILWVGVQAEQVPVLLLGAAPGAAKHAIRSYQMWCSGFMGKLVSEQTGLWKRRWLDITREVFVLAPFGVAVVTAGVQSGNILTAGVLVAVGVLMYYLNWRLLYMNDGQSYFMALFFMATAFSSAAQSVSGLLISALMAYRFSFMPSSASTLEHEKIGGTLSMLKTHLKSILTFPRFFPVRRPSLGATSHFLRSIPEHGRILAESHGRLREQNGWRSFWECVKDILLERRIALVNDMYTGMTEPVLDDRLTSRFNTEEKGPKELYEICVALGVGYVVAYSPKMVADLLEIGFKKIAEFDRSTLERALQVLLTRESIDHIVLLQHPNAPHVVAPKTKIRFTGRSLILDAERGETYYIRYRYDPRFNVSQGDSKLELIPYQPFEELPTTFMKLKSMGTQPITLSYEGLFFKS